MIKQLKAGFWRWLADVFYYMGQDDWCERAMVRHRALTGKDWGW